MEYKTNVSRLRRDMKEYYGTAMFNGFPMAVVDLSKVERISDRELDELAQKNGMDLRKYIVHGNYCRISGLIFTEGKVLI